MRDDYEINAHVNLWWLTAVKHNSLAGVIGGRVPHHVPAEAFGSSIDWTERTVRECN